MTGRGLWGQGISGPAQPRTKLLRVGHCRMSFLIILYVTNYSSECHSKPNGQKALGPKDPLQHPLPVWDEGRTWTNSEQGACHNGSSVPFLQRRGEDPRHSLTAPQVRVYLHGDQDTQERTLPSAALRPEYVVRVAAQ